MIRKSFQIEIITPVIMGGADSGKVDPYRIRLSEIKSAMRYVFRMVAGRYIDHSPESIKDLLEKEGKIFGSTSQKAKFKIWVEGTESLKTGNVKIIPHKSNFSKEAVLPGQTFTLHLQSLSREYSEEFYQSLLKVALLLGVGNRRNRLTGNMQIQNSPLIIKEEIEIINRVCRQLFNREEIKVNEPAYPTLNLRTDGEKNYAFLSIILKDEYVSKNGSILFEALLKELYISVIHELKKIKKEYILGSTNGGQGSAKQRQGSYVNFSIHREKQNQKNMYKLFLIAFYYKNEDFDYIKWKEAVEFTKEKLEETLKIKK